MSQQIQHYQTSFTVKGGEFDAGIKLYAAQMCIYNWIKGKESDRFRKMNRDVASSFLLTKGNFYRRAEYSSRHSWCKTNHCVLDGSRAWAVEYTHRDSESWDLFWITEIGLKCYQETNDLVVSVKVSYKYSTEMALAGALPKPCLSVPKCVKMMLEDPFDDCELTSGGIPIKAGLKNACVVNDMSLATRIAEYVRSPDRKLAVVILVGTTNDVLKEADCLSRNLFGKGLVFVIPCNELRNPFRGHRLNINDCLVLPPFAIHSVELEKRLKHNLGKRDSWEACRDELLRAWLGVHPVYESGSVSCLDDIDYWNRRQSYSRLLEKIRGSISVEEYESVKEQLCEVTGLFDLSEQDNKKLKSEKQELTKKNENLELQNMQLEDDKKSLIDQHKNELLGQGEKYKGMLRKRGESRELPRELPLCVDALKIWAASFENLVIAEKAWDGMKRRTQADMVKVAWDMLWCLNYPVFAFYGGDVKGVPGEYITGETGYEFSSNESSTTKSRKEWVAQRTVVINGRSFECFKHLKDGVGASTAMRVYFDYDAETAKIIVAHIGEHLTTKATART